MFWNYNLHDYSIDSKVFYRNFSHKFNTLFKYVQIANYKLQSSVCRTYEIIRGKKFDINALWCLYWDGKIAQWIIIIRLIEFCYYGYTIDLWLYRKSILKQIAIAFITIMYHSISDVIITFLYLLLLFFICNLITKSVEQNTLNDINYCIITKKKIFLFYCKH